MIYFAYFIKYKSKQIINYMADNISRFSGRLPTFRFSTPQDTDFIIDFGNTAFEEEAPSEETDTKCKILTSPQKTPTKVQSSVNRFRELLAQADPSQSIIRSEEERKLNGCVAEISTNAPTPSKPHVVRKLYGEILNQIPNKRKVEGDAGQLAKRACVALPQSTIEETIDDSWLNRLLVQFKTIHETSKQPGEKEIPWIVNETHITQMGDKGFHLCSSQEKLIVKTILEDSSTGVWFGEFPTSKGKQKKSTFFPISWTFDDVLKAMSKATILAKHQEKNRERVVLDFPGCAFKAEALLSHGGTVTWSCYPLWYYALFSKTARYDIFPGFSYTAEQIKEAGRTAERDCRMYELENGQKIIDVAKTLPLATIDRGVYIIFSSDDLDNS